MPPHVTLSQPNRYIIVIIGAFAVSFIGALFLAATDMGSNAPSAPATSVSAPATDHSKNPTMGDLHNILVPAGYLVGKFGNNMAWKKGDDAIYFEVHGSGNGQISRRHQAFGEIQSRP